MEYLYPKLEPLRESYWSLFSEFLDVSVHADFSRLPNTDDLFLPMVAQMGDAAKAVDALISVFSVEFAFAACRSSSEAATKLSFILFQDADKVEETAEEYRSGFNKGFQKKFRLRTERILETNETMGHPNARSYLRRIIEPFPESLGKSDKSSFGALNQKWGFVELNSWLLKNRKNQGIEDLVPAMAYYYGLSSHILHSDAVGISFGRDLREKKGSELETELLASASGAIVSLCCDALLVSQALHYQNAATSLDLAVMWNQAATVTKLADSILDPYWNAL